MTALPQDQASALRTLMQAHESEILEAAPPARRRAARVVAVASGKGGVGKTNLAVNLSVCLARRGRQVVLVDTDLGTANADVVLNVSPRWTLAHVVREQHSLNEVAYPVEKNFRLIAGASGLSDVADLSTTRRQHLIDELAQLEAESDLIILDCGAGVSQNVLAFAQAADELLVVTTPEPTAITDAYALIKILQRGKHTPPLKLVVNQAASHREGREVARRITSVAQRFLQLHISGTEPILRDPLVQQAVRKRQPFVSLYPRGPASTALSTLAQAIDPPRPEGGRPSGFFRKLFGFFD